jgi:hypothetical protein
VKRQILAATRRAKYRKLRQAQDIVDKSGKTKKIAGFAFFPLAGFGAPP